MTSVFVIAEVGSVHDGSIGNAMKLIDLARECGADAVKFQTHLAEEETVKNAPMPSFFRGEPRFEYFQRTAFSVDQWVKLKEHCDEQKIEFLSSPFSEASVRLLEAVGVKRHKIPSGEVTNLPLLALIGQTGKPVLLSSGMSTWEELDRAVRVLQENGGQVAILQCTSAYPCPLERVGLNVIDQLRARYHCEVGLSDHTMGNIAAFTAVARGATIIEKHLTFSRKMYGSDAAHSSEPAEFKQLTEGIRNIEVMINNEVDKNDIDHLKDMKAVFEKSLVYKCDIKKGDVLNTDMITLKKPGTGLAAEDIDGIIGRRALRDLSKDSLVRHEDLTAIE